MLLVKNGNDVVVKLSDAPPVNFCKPAVDPLFKSVAEIYGTATLAVVLVVERLVGVARAVGK